MEGRRFLTKIIIRTLLSLDTASLVKEARKLGKELAEGDNEGITKIFFITPDLTIGQKNVIQALIDKIGTGSVT